VGSGRGGGGGRQRGATRAALRLGYSAHRTKFSKALRLELEEEMARAQERLETWDASRLQREGYALFGLRGLHEGVLQRDAVVRVLIPRGGGANAAGTVGDPAAAAAAAAAGSGPLKRQFMMGAELPFHRFGQGDMVSLVEGDEHDASGKNAAQGVVLERAMHFLKIAINEEDEHKVLAARRLRLDLSANTIAHDRALAALVAFAEPGGMPGEACTRCVQFAHSLKSAWFQPLNLSSEKMVSQRMLFKCNLCTATARLRRNLVGGAPEQHRILSFTARPGEGGGSCTRCI
jgi:hypothetical protein